MTILLACVLILLSTPVSAATLWYTENFDDQDFDAPPSGTVETWVSMTTGCTTNPWCPYPDGAIEGDHYDFLETGYGGTGYAFGTAVSPETGSTTDPYFRILPSSWSSDGFFQSFRMKQTGVQSESYQNLKVVYPHWNGTNAYVMFNTTGTNVTPGTESLYYSAKDNTGAYLETSGSVSVPNIFDGNWHKFDLWVKFSTSEVYFWYDVESPTIANATFYRNYTDSAWSGATLYYFGANLSDVGDNVGFWDGKYIDNVEIWDELPTTTGATINATYH